MSDPKSLDHYIANPQDFDPSKIGPEDVTRLLAEADGKVPAPIDADPKPAAEIKADPAPAEKPAIEAKPAVDPKAVAPSSPAEPAREDKQVVLAPDGKSTIPYSVLQASREEARTAKTALAEALASADALTRQLEGKSTEGTPQSSEEIEASIAKIAEEAPELAEPLKAMMAPVLKQVRALEETVAKMRSERDEEAELTDAEIAGLIAQARDSNPALVHWMAEKPELWKEACALDLVLREQARWENRPLEERFQKVVDMMVADYGKDILPPTAQREPNKPAQPDPAAVATAAKAKLKEASERALPTTLSDLPGGNPPAQTEEEALENVPILSLHKNFMEMTPEKQRAFLANYQ